MRAARQVNEGDVHFIHAVLKTLQVIAWHLLDVPKIYDRVGLLAGEWRKRRRFALAEICEDQSHVFAGRIVTDLHFLRKAGVLRGLLDALARAIKFPAVVNATDVVALHPAQMHLRAAM